MTTQPLHAVAEEPIRWGCHIDKSPSGRVHVHSPTRSHWMDTEGHWFRYARTSNPLESIAIHPNYEDALADLAKSPKPPPDYTPPPPQPDYGALVAAAKEVLTMIPHYVICPSAQPMASHALQRLQAALIALSTLPTGLCSAHRRGEDRTCTVCYPALTPAPAKGGA